MTTLGIRNPESLGRMAVLLRPTRAQIVEVEILVKKFGLHNVSIDN